MTDLVRPLVQAVLLAILVGGVIGWWRIAKDWFKNADATNRSFSGYLNTLVPPAKQERPTWSLADFLLAFGLRILLPVMIIGLINDDTATQSLQPTGTETNVGSEIPDAAATNLLVSLSPTTQLSIQLLSLIASLFLTLAWLSILHRDSWYRIGLRANRQDIKLGLISTPLILVLVMVMSLLASAMVEYDHPVLQSLLEQNSVSFLTLTFLVTAIATPIFEEFLFRGLLQGSLQAIADSQPDVSQWQPRAHWPILISSFIFAMMHFPGQGAAPIPIFVLSVGLGYLYRQTGSLAPPIIVHVILNSITLIDAFTGT